MSKWYESDNPSTVVRGGSWRLAIWIIALIVFIGLISIGVWLFKVGTSDVKGQGDAVQTKNSGTNRIRAQEEYVQTYNDIVAADKRVQVMYDAKAIDPSTVNNTNYTGAVNFCIQLVADYDALIDKYTSADFIPEGYPEKIDTLNSETDCKENEE
jgi:hypothetical protein